MFQIFHSLFAKALGKNTASTPAPVILNQMAEKRPLPIGRAQFEEWSDRIIAGAMVTADVASQKFCLADMLTHLSPTTSFEADGYFISSIRKFAINQTAVEMKQEISDKAKAKLAAEEAAKAEQISEPTSDQ